MALVLFGCACSLGCTCQISEQKIISDTDKTFSGLCLCHSCTLYGHIDNYKCAGGVQCPFDELSSMSSLSAFEQLSEEEEKKIRGTGVGRSARPSTILIVRSQLEGEKKTNGS